MTNRNNRRKVVAGRYSVGDCIPGDSRIITGFGQEWDEGGTCKQVTDDTACAYGMEPGLDYYPTVRTAPQTVCYAYFTQGE